MRLRIRDGFGFADDGRRYWRDARGRWLRAHLSHPPVSVAALPSAWHPNATTLTHVAYRLGDEECVYVSPVAPDSGKRDAE